MRRRFESCRGHNPDPPYINGFRLHRLLAHRMDGCCVGRLLDIRFREQDIHAVSYGFQVVGEEPCVAIQCLGHIAVAKHVRDVLDVGAAGDGE